MNQYLNFSLEGKVALVTGASYGIGFAIASAFAEQGATICFNDINQELVDKGMAAYAAKGIKAHGYVCDVTDEPAVQAMVATIAKEVGTVDILVNNAGILEQGLKPIDRFLDEDMDRIIETNEKGTMRCMKAASKRMKSGASIVNVASVAGEKGCGGAAYVASKAAVIGLTKHTALRFQKDGIRCNAICPGNIITPMTMGTDPAALDPDMIGAMMNHSDIKAPSCTAEDVANVIIFFASDEAKAITGQIIVTDYGAML